LREAQAAGIQIFSQAENQVFRPAGAIIAPILVKLGKANFLLV